MTPPPEPTAMRLRLRTLPGDHPTTHALREGTVSSPALALDFADVAVANKAFNRASPGVALGDQQVVRRRGDG